MRNTYSVEQIQNTKTYRELAAKNETAKCNFLLERTSRHKMYHAYCVFKNTGTVPNTITGMYLNAVKDIIALENTEVDYSTVMTSEEIKLTDDETI